MARLLWPLLLLPEDGATDDVDAAPAREAGLVILDDESTDFDVIDVAEDVEELVLEEVLELFVDVAVTCASEARMDVTSV
jgi:hypothetical protein